MHSFLIYKAESNSVQIEGLPTYPNKYLNIQQQKKPYMTGILNTFLSLQEFTAQGL